MMSYINTIINATVEVMKHLGPLSGFFIIILESIIPALPLAAFIALNIYTFGMLWGFVISWVATIIGCSIAFFAFRKGFSKFLYRRVKVDGKMHKFMNRISDIRFSQLVLIIALPFTPAFAVNIAAGLSKMSYRKYLFALIIGKLSTIYFWGYAGDSFFEGIEKDPLILVQLGAIMALAYLISRLIQKYLKISEV
jgi:uncharacterized membrane protein YdjX (TVP38/TMEM64 family)